MDFRHLVRTFRASSKIHNVARAPQNRTHAHSNIYGFSRTGEEDYQSQKKIAILAFCWSDEENLYDHLRKMTGSVRSGEEGTGEKMCVHSKLGYIPLPWAYTTSKHMPAELSTWFCLREMCQTDDESWMENVEYCSLGQGMKLIGLLISTIVRCQRKPDIWYSFEKKI